MGIGPNYPAYPMQNYTYPYPMQGYQSPYTTFQQPAGNAQQAAQGAGQSALQIQNGGFVSVRNIEEARNYPVAPGNSVTFKDENAPYVYTKTMGFSQLDRPQFEKYRLVKEDDEAQRPVENAAKENAREPEYDARADIEAVRGQLRSVRSRMEEFERELAALKERPSAKRAETVRGTRQDSIEEDEAE